jgi:class 3 adenylate cyclase
LLEVAGERRHLTVLFCDLVDSTAIAAGLDPEDWRAIVAAYHHASAEAITRFGGYVAKYLGDGVMAFFGYPEAHDNDAERAARAGLAILDAISKLNDDAAHPALTARVGIDSGGVVVGTGAGKDADVFGDTPNVAARVQAAAKGGTVLVSTNTHRLLSGLFVVEDFGAQQLKGIEQPLHLYRVVRPSGVRGRLEATATSHGLTSFVGRDDELRSLAHRWERARDGEGQVVLTMGEAGIGKSRLLHRFRETLTGTPHIWIDAAAGAFYQNTPFYPVTEMLRQALFAGGDGHPDAIAQMAGALTQVGLDSAAAIPLLAPLLNLPLPPEYLCSSLPSDEQRRLLLATLVAWVLGTARVQPLIIATEDLHWADPSTLELIQLLVEQGNSAPLMLLYTARPEFHPPWLPRSHHTQST